MPDLLQTFLHDRDVSCPNCAYNLRDLTSDRCPECGQQITLGVQLARPRLAQFIAGIAPLAMTVGFYVLLFAMATIESLASSDYEEIGEYVAMLLIPGILSFGLLLAWVRWRGRVRRALLPVRICLITACWLVPPVMIFVTLVVDAVL